jgi:hypothetical protein
MAELKFKLDPTGFPMVQVGAIDAYMHWAPVTKIQFEYFLCAVPDSHFDANWYDEVLFLNPRVTPGEIRADNYWNAFLTGITPSEARRFARWFGPEYTIPTLEDWFVAYSALKALPPVPSSVVDNMGDLHERIRTVLVRLDTASRMAMENLGYERTLADQMLLRWGVMEWVECTDRRFEWGGMGRTLRSFYGGLFNPDSGQPSIPTNPDTERLYPYGFRLVWRPA